MKRTKRDRAEAIKRIVRDGPIRMDLLDIPAPALKRWAMVGKRGVYLDAIYDRETDEWFTSRAAVERFKQMAR